MRNRSMLVPWLLGGTLGLAQSGGLRASTAAVSPAAMAAQVGSPTAAKPASAPAVAASALKRVHLSLAATAIAPEKYRLVDLAGQAVATAVKADRTLEAEVQPGRVYALVPPAQGRQTLKPPETHVAMKGNTAPPPLRQARLEFPARYVSFDKNGNPYNEGGLFLRALRVPLVWDDAARAYATELVVGYDFKDGHGQQLAAKKTVTFFAEGPGARIEAETVDIDHSGSQGYKQVVLTTRQTSGEATFTARAGPVDELQASAPIQREPGSLDVTVPSGQLDAFGLGTGALGISLLARDGAPMAAPGPLEIHLTSRHLRLPTIVTLAAGQTTATADFRTIGVGHDEISAEAGTLKGSRPIQVAFPLGSVAAAVAGGILGGCARHLRNRRRSKSLFARRVVEGVLVGLLFVGAAWAGLVTVEISAGILTTPFGAFVLAALSGYLGCVVLDRVANRAVGGLAAP